MNGFQAAKAVAELLNTTPLGLVPRAEALPAPSRDPDEFEGTAVLTTVVWRQRRTEHEAKGRHVRVHTIDVAMQRRSGDDEDLFDELVGFADEVESLLIRTKINGLFRRDSFVGADQSHIFSHLLEHGIVTTVVTVEYEVEAD